MTYINYYWVNAVISFGLQWVGFTHAYLAQTERFYDIIGSITHLSIVIYMLSTKSGELQQRQYVVAFMILVWAARLGLFLFIRILSEGKDKRFDEIKKSFGKFFVAWNLQGLWIYLNVLPLTIIYYNDDPSLNAFNVLDGIGIALWTIGFLFEAISDFQKFQWRKLPDSKGKFIDIGLWAYSRHPNYFGEILLWIGITFICGTTYCQSPWYQLTGFITPLWVMTLLLFVSGLPMLEKSSDERFGTNPLYQEYKKRVPILIPWFTNYPPKESEYSIL